MADSTIIKEFLVALGWKIDEPGMRRFNEGIATADHRVRNFGLALGAMAVAVEESIRRVTRQFDNLFYLSQRTGVAASNIIGLRHAFRQAGLAAADADQMITSFAVGLRDNPGLRAFATSITGPFKDSADFIVKASRQYNEIISRFGDESGQARVFRLQMERLGIGAENLRQMAVNQGAVNRGLREAEDILRRFGIATRDGTADATELTRSWNTFYFIVERIFDTFIIKTFPTLNKLVATLGKVLLDNADKINAAADDFGKWVQSEKGIDQVTDAIKRMGTVIAGLQTGVEYIWSFFKWVTEHPTLVSALSGAAIGGRFGGIPGAIVGGTVGAGIAAGGGDAVDAGNLLKRQNEDLERRLRSRPGLGKRSDLGPGFHPAAFVTGGAGEDSDTLLLRGLTNWWSGNAAFRPIVDLAANVYDKLASALREGFGLPTQPETGTGGSAASTSGGRAGSVAGGRMPGHVSPGKGSSADPRGMEAVIRAAAAQYGVDPDVAVKVARSEGLGTFTGDHGTSFGAFQLHRGGLGDEFKRDTGLDPSDPKNESETIYWAMKNVGRTGWGPYHGAARVGIAPRAGIGAPPTGGRFGGQSAITKATAMAAAAKGKADRWMAEHWDELPGMGAKDKPYHWVDKFTDTPEPEYGPGSPWGRGPPLGVESPRGVNIDSDHKVEINVHGANDTHGVAAAVRDAQDRHSALHIRNLRTSIA